jgi:predicted dehydrogenase
MIEAADRHGLPLFVAYYRRALPRFEAMRQRIREGAIGEVRAIVLRHIRPGTYAPRIAWKLDPEVNGGGLFVDIKVHTLDWLDHCFGPPSVVQGLVRRLGDGKAEDLVAYTLGWDAGPVASGVYCFGAGPEEEIVTIFGTEGSVSMKFFAGPGFTIRRIDAPGETVAIPDPPHVHEPLITRIVDELRGGPPAPSRATDAIRTTRLVDALYADYRAGRWPSALTKADA